MGSVTTDVAELASRLRLGVTRLARRLRQAGEPGVTPALLSALSAIDRRGRITIGELSTVEQVRPPTMTRMVAVLVGAGLVVREPDPADRRVAWVSVTSEGARLLQRSRGRKDAYLVRRMRALEPRQLAVLEEAVGILEQLTEGRP